MEVILAQPRGFCGGAIRAIRIVERALGRYGRPVYVLHEIVHNRHVIENLRDRGVVFIECLDEVPAGAVTIFSAHGVSTAIAEEAERRGLRVIDATCPLITKIHSQVQQFSREGFEIIIIGHSGHAEIEGIRGRIEGPVQVISSMGDVDKLRVRDPERLAYVTQTTLSVDDTAHIIAALKRRFMIQGPNANNICYATQSRQNSVKRLADSIDVLLVIGSRNSSNSNRLREIGEQKGIASYLIEDADDLKHLWFRSTMRVGITAGASAPEEIVQGVLQRLREDFHCKVVEMERDLGEDLVARSGFKDFQEVNRT